MANALATASRDRARSAKVRKKTQKPAPVRAARIAPLRLFNLVEGSRAGTYAHAATCNASEEEEQSKIKEEKSNRQ